MARGWESKSVESQIDSTQALRSARYDGRTTAQIDRDARKSSLLLSRTRVLHDLQVACNPRYRLQLEQALAHLDQQIAMLD